jgi:hypothetical protein
MLPKEVRGIRLFQLHPEFFEPFIQARIDDAMWEVKKSEDYRMNEANLIFLSEKLSASICEEQKKLFFE